MKNNWMKYNKKLLSCYFGVLAFLVFFNITIDPFCIFNSPKIKYYNVLKPHVDRNQRVTKIIDLKLHKTPIEAIFLGSSRVNTSINPEFYFELSGKTAKNLGMNALSHDETFKVAKNVLLIHPEVKTVYVGLDFFRFLERNKDNKRDVPLVDSKNLSISEFNPVVLSFNATIASVNTLIANIKPQKNVDKVSVFKYKLKQYSYNYKDAVLSEEEIEKLANFKTILNKEGYNVVFYTNPTHVSDMALIKEMGYLSVFNDWKVKLSEYFEFIDFAVVNDITSEPINQDTKYFYESSHSTKLMGNVIIERLLLNNNKYGTLVTNKNVKKINRENEKNLIDWEKQNSYWTNEVIGAINNEI